MVISARTFWLIAHFSILMAAARLGAAEPPEQIKPDSILERFAIARSGDAILVPVTIERKEHLFLLDTGCSNTILDSSLSLPGAPKQSVVVATPVLLFDVVVTLASLFVVVVTPVLLFVFVVIPVSLFSVSVTPVFLSVVVVTPVFPFIVVVIPVLLFSVSVTPVFLFVVVVIPVFLFVT